MRDRNKAKQSKVNFVWQLFASLPFVVGRADLAKTQGNINQVQIGLGYRNPARLGHVQGKRRREGMVYSETETGRDREKDIIYSLLINSFYY